MTINLSALNAANGYGAIGQVAAPLAATPATPTAPAQDTAKPVAQAAETFAKVFDQADVAVAEMATGRGSAQAVVEAMAQAELALQTAVTIRDRVVEAYQEILRMPV